MKTFNALGLSEDILRGVVAAGYTTPTPIQESAIPVICAGRDLIGCAQTGTGKTAAFVLPMLDRLWADRKARGVRALVVTPTRELAGQVEDAVRTYGQATRLRSTAIYGGVAMHPQFRDLRRGVDIVVATPGRLLDHMNQGSIDLSAVEILVLDEADRMLDMGFINDIRKIIAAVPKKRQTLLFSATMHEAVRKLADTILNNPESIVVGNRRNPAETVMQQVCSVAQDRKMDLLFHVLRTEPVENVLIFSRTKHRADKITKKLGQEGWTATAMHSNKSQNQRQRALDGFRDGKYQIMVATDIAARGIDVDGISHVINFDTPNQPEDYIHRIGRTGRAEMTGDAITFVAHDEMAYLKLIERHTGRKLERKTYDGFESRGSTESQEVVVEAPRSGGYPGQGRGSYSTRPNSRGGSSWSGGSVRKGFRNARNK